MRFFFRCHGPFIIILLFVAICTAARASRLLSLPSTEQGRKYTGKVEATITGVLSQVGLPEGIEEEDAWNLMNLEDCGNADNKECSSRRMLTDAHLDYIYTQRHKP
ncbi:hypothetical protein Taro_011819 [Colocasia esculenta]|uniref:Phytosulfokine n=1 Tax=Colocasia esculenta TaxID=4460 RepID=A0A843U772_COLES|nr:hypothetical protein [Colocasia esculenta]